MGTLVREAPREHWQWLTSRTGYAPAADFVAVEARNEQGGILGMVGFDHWTKSSAQAHVAIEQPTRALLEAAFEVPFVLAGKRVLIGLTRAGNARVQRLAAHLGFSVEARVRDGWDIGEDLVLWRMERAACRWLPEERRQS